MQLFSAVAKGQLISKADWRAIDSPKKSFVCLKIKKANKSKSSVRLLGKSTARQSVF